MTMTSLVAVAPRASCRENHSKWLQWFLKEGKTGYKMVYTLCIYVKPISVTKLEFTQTKK